MSEMIKQVIALIAFSVVVILFTPYAQHGVEWILAAHNWVSELLTQVFTGGPAGDIIRKLLALMAIPITIGMIPVIIYWFMRRHWMPYFMQIVSATWLIQTAALVVQAKVAG
jgi:hypothetical protein